MKPEPSDLALELIDALSRFSARSTELCRTYATERGEADPLALALAVARIEAVMATHQIMQEEFQSVDAQLKSEGRR